MDTRIEVTNDKGENNGRRWCQCTAMLLAASHTGMAHSTYTQCNGMSGSHASREAESQANVTCTAIY